MSQKKAKVMNFPNKEHKLSPEQEKELAEIEKKSQEEAAYIVSYLHDEPAENAIIENYRKNLYDDFIEGLFKM